MSRQDSKPVRLARPGGDSHTEMNRVAKIILEKELLSLYPELMEKGGTYPWAQVHAHSLHRVVMGLELSIEKRWAAARPLREFQTTLYRWMMAVLAMYEARWMAGQGEGKPARSPDSSPHPSSVSEKAVQSSLFDGLEAI